MVYGAVLYFDPSTEARLRALWQQLADQGISDVMAASSLRPHLSLLGVDDAAGPGRVQRELEALARRTPPLTVQLAAVGIFPGDDGVVYIAPVVTADLLAVHEALHGRLAGLGEPTAALYRPGIWVPHCTVAIRLDVEGVPAAVAACCRSDVFGPAQLVELGFVQHPPACELAVFPLTGAGG